MNNIFIYTGSYPFNIFSESFLESEILILKQSNYKINIIPVKKDLYLRKIPNNVNLIRDICDRSLFNNLIAIISIFTSGIFKEYIRSKEFVFSKKYLIDSVKYLYAASLVYMDLEKRTNNKEKCIFYSYWLTYAPIAFALWKKNNKNTNCVFISRGHGSDVYANDVGIYYPLRSFIFKYIDKVYLVSNYGVNYLKNKYPQYTDKFELSRLGVYDNFSIRKKQTNTNILKIVSCARVYNIKRVDLLFESIYNFACKFPEIKIEWQHIGDGELFNKLNDLISSKNKLSNFNSCLYGNLSNEQILKIYREEIFNCFILISTTEGIPVSIMEAIASKIPIIATNVGGVSEIVNSETGILLNKDFTQEEFNNSLLEIIQNYNIYSESAYYFFKKNFDAETNYNNFFKKISQI